MFYRLFVSIFLLNTFLLAQCTYKLDVKFDFKNKNIDVFANIFDSEKTLFLDTTSLKIKNKKSLIKALNNGTNKVSFFYTKRVENLNKEYIYLLNNWYPKLENRCSFTINTNLPSSYKMVFENTNKEIDKFSFIASSKFIINSKKYKDINIQTYFLNKNQKLSNTYIDKTIQYLKLYENMIGKFPYKNFKVVENIYQTGYSMATFTLIGSRLLSKPYILNQSLGHELLHQYFGNSIFNDFQEGNWVEGLTTYLADDYYKKQVNKDRVQRKVILNEYEKFVNENNDFPIKDFIYKKDKASSLIGYSKLSFVFHMLENKIGKEKFKKLIPKFYKENKFKEINLAEVANFFDLNTQIDLKEFFKQWLDKKGKIDFKIENINTLYNKNGFLLSFEILQDEKNFYSFDLPLDVKTYDENIFKIIPIRKNKEKIELLFNSEVLEVNFDKNIDLFRKLSKKEKLLSISSLINEPKLLAVVDKEDKEKYRNIKTIFPQAKIVLSDELKFNDIKENSILFLDLKNTLLPTFFSNIKIDNKNTYLNVKKHIYNDSKYMAVINFGEYKSRYLMMLKHYSTYKKVIFTKDEIIKIKDKSSFGINKILNTIPSFIEVEKKQSLKNIIKKLDKERIIYVSESHDNFRHHLNQLRVIKALYKAGKKVVIAMEMFQKPFQKDLDEYIAGKTTLDEFLKNSEYFKRWKFDYNLYKPIIDYAKKNKIKVLALNVDREITKQVSKKGLLSLSKKQKELLPKEIDQSNLEYKKSLESIFNEHKPKGKTKDSPHGKMPKLDTDLFYQSQLIWDEIMAENIDNYIKEHTDTTVVVIAGSGHIKEHNGIPSRVYRRNTLPYKVILNDAITSKVNDIVVINKNITNLNLQKKLGVFLKSDTQLEVMGVLDNSFSSKIGIEKGDKLLKIAEKEVNTLADVKRVLYFIDELNNVIIEINRDKKLKKLKIGD